MQRVFFQSKLADNGRERDSTEAALKKCAEVISKEPNSARMATLVHRASYDALGIGDPYHDLKVRADNVAAGYIDRVRKFIDGSEDKFRDAVKVSIMGNIMDFGAGIAIDSPEEFDDVFESLLKMELTIDDTEKISELLSSGGTVVYFFDNCGEAIFDMPLLEQIRSMGNRVVGVVRGEPILNDVTAEDAYRIGLDEHLDRMLDTGAFAIGVDITKIGKELKEEMNGACIVMAKGMANFESMNDEGLSVPVAYLMKAKCIPVASEIGVGVGSNVAKLIFQ
jgi:uncharacterized protein with ATP-grasp and redox domains